MHVIYEYLFTAVIVVSITVASSIMLTTVSTPLQLISEREQLKEATEKLLNQILLCAGEPGNWGSDTSVRDGNLAVFGLAIQGETTRKAYVLDVDKVLRLDPNNPLYIHPSKVKNLMNLGRDYGFAIKIFPALNVSISPYEGLDKFNVTVLNLENLPVSNANVTARIYYANVSNGIVTYSSTDNLTRSLTDFDGKCLADFGKISSEMKVLIIEINYYGMRVVRVFHVGKNVVPAYLIGQHLYVEQGYAVFPLDESKAIEIMVFNRAGQSEIESLAYSLDPMSQESLSEYVVTYLEPNIVSIASVLENGGAYYLAVASKDVNLTYSSIQEAPSFPWGYQIQRVVTIGGSTYFVMLHLWRMSW